MRSPHLAIPLLITLFLTGIYLLTTGGHFYAIDEEQMFVLTEAIVTRGSFAVGEEQGVPTYSKFGPGQSLMAVPFFIIGWAVATLFPPEGYIYLTRALASWLNPFVTGATGGLIALAALRLGYSRRTAIGTALIYGLATLAWPHSQSFFAEPLAAALTFAGFALALPPPEQQRAGTGRWLAAGFCAALACSVKIQAGLLLPLLGLWVIWEGVLSRAAREEWARRLPAHRSYQQLLIAGALRTIAPWLLGALLGLALLGSYQWLLFGNPLRSGYGDASRSFSGYLSVGLYGLILSPGKGIIWYAPPLMLLPVGLVLLWQRNRGVALLASAATVATFLFYGLVVFWHGDGAWGPRYLNMVLPFMVLPLAALIEQLPRPNLRPLRPLLLATLLIAVPVQLAGVLINLNAYLDVQRDSYRRYFEPSQSPILGHLRLVGAQLAQSYALHVAPGSLALVDGFSYSEGDRDRGEQLPRWSLPSATIAIRPPAGSTTVQVSLSMSSCLPAPLPPTDLSLALNGAPLTTGAACPPRRYAMLLPDAPSRLTLESSGWNPADVGLERKGPLGVSILQAYATADGEPLTLTGRLVPIEPAPVGQNSLRRWASDYRYGHWDLWLWYLVHAGFPLGPTTFVAILWGGMGLSFVSIGLVGLWKVQRGDRNYSQLG